jgi:hypothetical protein
MTSAFLLADVFSAMNILKRMPVIAISVTMLKMST